MASAGVLRTDDAVNFAQNAGQAGADGILFVSVYYIILPDLV